MKNFALTLTTAGLAALVLTGCGKAGSSTALAKPAPEPVRVTTARVESRVLPATLEVTGALTADETADIAAERDGRVAAVLVERGTYVAKGAVLARLDETEAKAALEEAKANIAWTTSESQRYAELREKGVVARAERQRKDVDLDTARARLTLAQKGLDDCTIRAPFGGLVTEKKISAGAFVQRGQPVAGLVSIEPLRAALAIPESAVTAVRVGQRVALSVQTFPGRAFDGRIAYIGPSLKAEARTLVVEAIVPNPGRLLKPGLFVSAAIELPASAAALVVPRDALVSESGVARLYVVGPESVSERIVALGATHGALVEVKQGVSAGEKVVLRPDRRLADGLQIER